MQDRFSGHPWASRGIWRQRHRQANVQAVRMRQASLTASVATLHRTRRAHREGLSRMCTAGRSPLRASTRGRGPLQDLDRRVDERVGRRQAGGAREAVPAPSASRGRLVAACDERHRCSRGRYYPPFRRGDVPSTGDGSRISTRIDGLRRAYGAGDRAFHCATGRTFHAAPSAARAAAAASPKRPRCAVRARASSA